MGDCRYYTPEQFFSIITFTTLIIFVVIDFMLSLYKIESHKRAIRTLGIIMLVSLLSAFTFEIAYSETVIILSDYISSMALLVYLIINVILIIKSKNNRYFTLSIFLILLLLPMIFIIKAELDTNVINVLYTMHYILISNKFTKYKVSSSVFNDVKKLMLDYVFIISDSGDVIFRNDKVLYSDIFSDDRLIDIEAIHKLFNNKITMRTAFSKQFIKVESSKDFFFQYHKKEIMDKGKLAGYILTFVDVTELILMLDTLSDNREQTKKTNIKLDKYKDIVYDVEKEKEINALLDEIANNQQKSMYILREKLEELDVNDDRFLDDLEEISANAKMNLSDVREAVTSYK